MNLINSEDMRYSLLLILFILSDSVLAARNYTLHCLKDQLSDKHCQKIQDNLALWKADITKEANQAQVPVALFTAIIAIESHFNPYSRSQFGSIGLTQIQAKTAKSLGYTAEQLKDPKKNLQAGALYLKTLLDQHRSIDAAVMVYKTGKKISARNMTPSVKTYLNQVTELSDHFTAEENQLRK